MGRSQETFNKKEVRNRKEKKRKEKAEKRQAKKESDKKASFDDMIAYVDENGQITDTPPSPIKKKKETKLEDIQIGAAKRTKDDDVEKIRKGKITYFNENKGFGFIKDALSQESIFVHINNSQDEISEGIQVSFEIEKGPKGPIAVNVKAI